MKKQQKTISAAERIDGLMNIAANNKMKGSQFIKPSFSALGNMFPTGKNGNQIINKTMFQYN